jgi:nicotinamide riboside kinase
MKIAVIGPQNTGKSTFIQDFLKYFKSYSTPNETYRDLVKKQGLNINQMTSVESQKLIRNFLFAQLRSNEIKNIIFDRCLIDNYVYTYVQYEAGLIPKSFVDETYNMMIDSLDYADMYVLIPASLSVGLVNDTLRDIDTKYIDKVNHHFLRILFELSRDRHINVKIISGSRDDRMEQIKKIV